MIDIALFASPSAVAGFSDSIKGSDVDLSSVHMIAIGHSTGQALDKLGVNFVVAEPHNAEGLLKACLESVS
ncbi:MAG: uroporphyrinogen-III synthase [Candidatus Lindowbacteria bacterium]|nr:uroporphyrinogen-III synthase [Candidatus Lindowbacteria bacterium]